MNYTEDTLVQQTTAENLEQELGWQSVRYTPTTTRGTNRTAGHTFRETG